LRYFKPAFTQIFMAICGIAPLLLKISWEVDELDFMVLQWGDSGLREWDLGVGD
jgi:hypothetical protein